ncbi:ABC transporter substrate-binding protein [Bordetella pertussis]|nr:ABC transporter substrate-binding protein [Bordetella pertussis]
MVQAFVGALVKAQDFISANSAAAVTDLIYDDYLNAYARPVIEKTIGLYQQTVFLRDNIITEDAYARMTAIMGDGRQFSNEELKKVPYSACVDMRFVRKARGL